jgi:hypothetical protein
MAQAAVYESIWINHVRFLQHHLELRSLPMQPTMWNWFQQEIPLFISMPLIAALELHLVVQTPCLDT